MTDFERTKQFLDSLGILYVHNKLDNSIQFGVPLHKKDRDYYPHPKCDKVSGYGGNYTSFEFDKNGEFIRVGAWE
jgi:hypothetical protein